MPRDQSRPATRSRTRSRRCSTTWPSATTSPTTCSRWARPGSGAGRSPARSTPGRASGCSTSPPAPASSSLPFARGRRPGRRLRLLPRHAPGRQARRTRRWTCSPATRCGCRSPTASFDAVTISFGLRNVADVDAALAEMARVTRPGGRLVVCEFSHPTWAPFRTVYSELPDARAAAGGPRGCRATRTPTSTSPSRSGPGRTSRRWPSGSRAAGWDGVGWRNLTGGIVALHRAQRGPDGVSARRGPAKGRVRNTT